MATRTFFTEPVAEAKTARYEARLVDEASNPIPGSTLTALTLTVFALLEGRPIVNGLDDCDLTTDPRGSVDEEGNLVLILEPDDMVIVDTTRLQERHVAQLEWEWGEGKKGAHEFQFTVRNFDKVSSG